MAETYLFVNEIGNICKLEYEQNSTIYKIDNIKKILVDTLNQYSNEVSLDLVDNEYPEVYIAKWNFPTRKDLIICIKKTTPGGRKNLKDEQRIQQSSKYINFAHQQNKLTLQLGVYKFNDLIIFCAWKFKPSTSDSSPISKQIQIETIQQAIQNGFSQQKNKKGEFVCAFRPELFYFYLENLTWLHDDNLENLSAHVDHNISQRYYSNFHSENIIFYGVPGSGKSHKIKENYKPNADNSMRVVFHPDYTYSDFVGQILPKILKGENDSEDKLKYEFSPGPFTKILKKAYDNPEQQFYLIIEELNRGNAPAIFGEIFQLLDRNESGESEYSITNAEIAQEVFQNSEMPIKIPANLSILATMNTSDQNVFTMDTAFQRRWVMVHIPNKFESPQAEQKIVNTKITWKAFADTVNDKLAEISGELTSTEDKSLGAYFAREADFKDRSRFAEKVLKYLWDDAFKMERSAIFKASFKTLSSVIEKFEDDKIENPLNEVLDSKIYEDICERMKETSSMQEQAQRIEE